MKIGNTFLWPLVLSMLGSSLTTVCPVGVESQCFSVLWAIDLSLKSGIIFTGNERR